MGLDLAKVNRSEQVFVTFHYIEKGIRREDGEFDVKSFSQADFDRLSEKIKSQPLPNLKKACDFDGVKFGKIIPFSKIEKDGRLLQGMFKGAYSGHSFENSDKGKIEANSINQRDFHFVLYFTESGKIVVGCQYLGNYGNYTDLSKQIFKFLGLGASVRASSVRNDAEDFRQTVPTEVRIEIARASKEITKGQVFSSGSLVAFRRQDGDDDFELEVKERVLSLIGKPESVIKKEIAKLLNKNESYKVDESEIENCTVLAKRNGRQQTIYLFGDGVRATKFLLDVPLDGDGLPKFEETRAAMFRKLKSEIISKLENV